MKALALSTLALSALLLTGMGPKPPKGSHQCSASGWSLEQDCHQGPGGGTICTPHQVNRLYVGEPAKTQSEAAASAMETCDGFASGCQLSDCWKN